MKPKPLLCLALVLSGGLLGCATQSQRTTQSDRAHAQEAALRYEFDKWDMIWKRYPPRVDSTISEYVIEVTENTAEDTENTAWLVKEFRGHKPPVFGWGDTNAIDCSNCRFLWSAKIQNIKDDHAAIYVQRSSWTEDVDGYILKLHREKRQWIVDSETQSQTGL